jgi:hypothetical protein
MESRKVTPDEARLLTELAAIAGIRTPSDWVQTLRVRSMEDGGMGSLQFETAAPTVVACDSIVCRAAVQFTDADGIEVIASLNARNGGEPFELDVWKTDFSSLIRIPQQFRRLM